MYDIRVDVMDFYKVCCSVLDVLLTCRLLYDHGYNQERTEKKRKNLHSSIPIDGVSRDTFVSGASKHAGRN